MPKGLKGFQKGHKSFSTPESRKRAAENISKALKGKYKGRRLNTGRTHFKKNHGMNKTFENPMWKGGKFKTKDGYMKILVHGHPMAQSSGYIFEHRLIMSNHLKRILKLNEVVHHINGKKR